MRAAGATQTRSPLSTARAVLEPKQRTPASSWWLQLFRPQPAWLHCSSLVAGEPVQCVAPGSHNTSSSQMRFCWDTATLRPYPEAYSPPAYPIIRHASAGASLTGAPVLPPPGLLNRSSHTLPQTPL